MLALREHIVMLIHFSSPLRRESHMGPVTYRIIDPAEAIFFEYIAGQLVPLKSHDAALAGNRRDLAPKMVRKGLYAAH